MSSLRLSPTFFLILAWCFSTAAAQNSPAVYRGKSAAQWIELLKNKEDENIRRQAAYALGQIGPAAKEAVPALSAALDDVKAEVRWYAVDALGRMRSAAKGSVAKIITAVKEEYEVTGKASAVTFAIAAADTLGKIGPDAKEAIPFLLEATGTDQIPYRVAAARALWKIDRHQKGVEVLIDVLQSGTGNNPYQACAALAEIDAPPAQVRDAAIAALGHSDIDVRRAAASALGEWGLPMLEPLAQAMSQSKTIDPLRAAYALGKIANNVRVSTLHNAKANAETFDNSATPLLKHAVPVLMKLLNHPQQNVQQAAAIGLARMGPLAAADLLVALRDETTNVRAAESLAAMENYLPNDKQASPKLTALKNGLLTPLTEAIQEKDIQVRRPAVRLLAELKLGPAAKDAAPLLTAALQDEDATVRFYASKTLQQIND